MRCVARVGGRSASPAIGASPSAGMVATRSMSIWRTITDGRWTDHERIAGDAPRRALARGCDAGPRADPGRDRPAARRLPADPACDPDRAHTGHPRDGAAFGQAVRKWPGPLARAAVPL